MNEWMRTRGEPREMRSERKAGSMGWGYRPCIRHLDFILKLMERQLKGFKQMLTWSDLHCWEEITLWQVGEQIWMSQSGESQFLSELTVTYLWHHLLRWSVMASSPCPHLSITWNISNMMLDYGKGAKSVGSFKVSLFIFISADTIKVRVTTLALFAPFTMRWAEEMGLSLVRSSGLISQDYNIYWSRGLYEFLRVLSHLIHQTSSALSLTVKSTTSSPTSISFSSRATQSAFPSLQQTGVDMRLNPDHCHTDKKMEGMESPSA